jgi:iron uptake system component EfeO
MTLPRARATAATALSAAVLVATLTGCTVNRPAGGSTSDGVAVTASDTSCALSATTAKSGTSTFTVTNRGTKTTEYELLAADGLTIVGEVENLGPGLSRSLSVQMQPGTYTSLCKPGMVGDGVGRTSFRVTGGSVSLSGDSASLAKAAASRYVAYVRDQARTLLTRTRAFAAAYTAGNDAKARSLYPQARSYFERIEPVAEKFGTLDRQLDAREADVASGDDWSGWHRIEKDLWRPTAAQNGGKPYRALTTEERRQQADLLVTRTEALLKKVEADSFTVSADAISNGAIGLLDEIAATKVTGEEETWSHTDLTDFTANVQGAEVAYRGVRDLAKAHDRSLVATLDSRFAALDARLAKYGSLEKGFVSYTALSKSDVKALSDAVNALSEPLSALTAAVLE